MRNILNYENVDGIESICGEKNMYRERIGILFVVII